MSFTSLGANPAASTLMLYPDPGVRAGAEKTPAPFVSIDRTCPCAVLETTTLAFGTTDPVGSLTVPEIAATPPVWAKTGAHKNMNAGKAYFTFITGSLKMV